ncbi:immunity 63 family protein [Actinoplanes sp. TRM 88003]|uniref:Immunity 63 family protein n=1 Tax=Paractinoplanes aksuensis TaxID=2939490 RepID=A0ABT1DN48_9ACTN|nr:Imm63 family immunity protein [Actinoplanes aksuensis]MCO8271506.1 immunity 63 family protein [Actinoplanes aksuensis]
MKQFRRDSGPGNSQGGLEVLRAEVDRLGALINAPTADLVAFEPRDAAHPYVQVDADGTYHWLVVERGQVLQDRTTTSRDEILYWSFDATTYAMAGVWATHHPVEEQEFRVTLWERQFALLRALDPEWEQRRRREQAERLP